MVLGTGLITFPAATTAPGQASEIVRREKRRLDRAGKANADTAAGGFSALPREVQSTQLSLYDFGLQAVLHSLKPVHA
jgi:hypothetical protein